MLFNLFFFNWNKSIIHCDRKHIIDISMGIVIKGIIYQSGNYVGELIKNGTFLLLPSHVSKLSKRY